MVLTTFYPEESDLEANSKLSLDIIAIHGLNGNQLNTWTEPKSEKLWLRDFLPKDQKGARVMTFGYDATAAFSASVAGVGDHARGLLGELIEKRGRRLEANRPLIFIGHSLGGLVIKQALVIAGQEETYTSIYESTLGIIFFGTPHQGSSIASHATAITRTLLPLARQPDAELLKTLRKGSPSLKRLGEDWKKHHERRPYNIVSFYETRTMRGLRGLIVEKTSALLTTQGETPTFEDQIPVVANHREMCRFSSSEDGTYKAAIRSIRRIQQSCKAQIKHEFYIVHHSPSPNFTGRSDILDELSDSLLSYRGLKGQQRFVLYGLGGSGKTQICLQFAQENRESFWGIFWIDASSEETVSEGFKKVARECNQGDSIDAVKAWLSRKDHWLLILDNADNPDMDISEFFPSQGRGSILITSRNPDLQKHGNAGFLKVDKLCSKDAVTLLLKTAAIADDQDNNGNEVAEKVVVALGYLALAITQAGAIIRQGVCSLDGFCDVYSRQREILELGRSTGSIDAYQFSVFTTWEISIKTIEEMPGKPAKLAVELLRIFSWMHFDGISEETFRNARTYSFKRTDIEIYNHSLLAASMPSGWDSVVWGSAVRLLVQFSLVACHSGHLSMHPLVHLWSRDRMRESERANAWKIALVTVGVSITGLIDEQQTRRLLLPHVDSVLQHSTDELLALGPDVAEQSYAIHRFHDILTDSGQFHKALRLSQALLKAMETILDPTDALYQYHKSVVGADLRLLGRYRESANWLEALTEDLAVSGGPRYDGLYFATELDIAYTLGICYNRLDQHQKALDICTGALARFEDVCTPESPFLLPIYGAMGEALSGLRRPKEALTWTTKYLQTCQKLYGPSDSTTLLATGYLADHYANRKDYKTAIDLQKRCVDGYKTTFGDDHATTIYAEEILIDFTAQRKMNTMSRKRIIGRRRNLCNKMMEEFGETDWRTLSCQSGLASDYIACASFQKARIMQEQWVDVMIREFGRDDPRTIDGIAALARTKKWIAMRKAMYWWLPQCIFE